MHNTNTILLGLMISLLLASCTNQSNKLNPADLPTSKKTIPTEDKLANTIPTTCSTELLRPAVFREEPLKVLVYDSSASFSNIPAEVVWSEIKIQVEPARYAQETEPAQYEEFEDVIEIERSRSELYATPAKYQQVIREITIQPEYKRWKEGCLASTTSACTETVAANLAKVPHIIQAPAQINQRRIPSQTLKIKRKKLLKAGKGLEPILPARYETVKLWRVSKPWKIISSLVAAQYETIMIQRKLRDTQAVTMPTACTAALTSQQISQIQQALLEQGQSLAISGRLDTTTILALHAFQAAHQLAVGGVSLETLRKLGLA